MARGPDPDSAGSQFFICLAPVRRLDGQYTTFGKLIKGDDVLEKIGNTPVERNAQGEMSKPTKRVVIESVKIVPAELGEVEELRSGCQLARLRHAGRHVDRDSQGCLSSIAASLNAN